MDSDWLWRGGGAADEVIEGMDDTAGATESNGFIAATETGSHRPERTMPTGGTCHLASSRAVIRTFRVYSGTVELTRRTGTALGSARSKRALDERRRPVHRPQTPAQGSWWVSEKQRPASARALPSTEHQPDTAASAHGEREGWTCRCPAGPPARTCRPDSSAAMEDLRARPGPKRSRSTRSRSRRPRSRRSVLVRITPPVIRSCRPGGPLVALRDVARTGYVFGTTRPAWMSPVEDRSSTSSRLS